MDNSKILTQYLRYYGIVSMIFIPIVPFFFRDIFMWEPKNTAIEIMIVSIYFVLGLQMLNISKNPIEHKSFIDFIILASLIHSLTMLVFAENYKHILFDVIPIGFMGIIPLVVYPWGLKNFLKTTTTN